MWPFSNSSHSSDSSDSIERAAPRSDQATQLSAQRARVILRSELKEMLNLDGVFSSDEKAAMRERWDELSSDELTIMISMGRRRLITRSQRSDSVKRSSETVIL